MRPAIFWKPCFASVLLLLLMGCNGQWSRPGGGAGGGAGQGGGGGQGRNRPKASNDEVLTAYASLLQAFQKKDMDALDRLFAANSTVSAPPLGARVMAWSDARPIVEQAVRSSGDLQFSDNKNGIVGIDRDMGWIASSYHVHESTPKGPSDSDGVMMVVFRKTEEGYKIIAFQAARVAAAAPAPPARK
jgi:ketosteroid isomerase-like protein